MSTLTGTVYPLGSFSWNKETKTLSSTLTNSPKCLRTLWSDSLDLGFGLKSEKTGKTAFFVLDSIDKDEDGQVHAWHFKVHNPDNQVAIAGLRAIVRR